MEIIVHKVLSSSHSIIKRNLAEYFGPTQPPLRDVNNQRTVDGIVGRFSSLSFALCLVFTPISYVDPILSCKRHMVTQAVAFSAVADEKAGMYPHAGKSSEHIPRASFRPSFCNNSSACNMHW